MDQDNLGQRTRKIPEQPVAPLYFLIALTERVEQPVDRECDIRHFAVLTNAEPVSDRGVGRHRDHLFTEPPNPLLQPTPGDHGNRRRNDRRRQQQRQRDQY